MRRELKSSVSVAASLVLGFFLLFSQSTANPIFADTELSRQSSTGFSPAQQVIADLAVGTQKKLESLIASGVNLLQSRPGKGAFILTTFAKLEELKNQGWQVTLLYVRGLDENSPWLSVEAPSGGCTYSISPTEKSFPSGGGVSSFTLTTNPECEWTVFADFSWIQVNHIGQGTGSTTISFSVAANGTNTNRIGHIFVNGQIFTIYQGALFNDVPVGHPFYTEIGKLSARGITLGCGNNNFCPNDPVLRDQMAAFILRARGEFNPPTPGAQRYTDVPPSNQFYNFIDRLAELGITLGCTATTYCPTESVRREQAAAFIIRGLGEFNPPTPATQRFGDVPPTNPFYNFIDRMAALGITQGCSTAPPLFCPTTPMTRGQMAAFLVRAFNLQ